MRTHVRTYVRTHMRTVRTHSVRNMRIVRTHVRTHMRTFFLTNFKKKLLQMKILVKIQGFYEIPKKKNLPLSARVWPRLRADSRGKGSGKGYGEGLKRWMGGLYKEEKY